MKYEVVKGCVISGQGYKAGDVVDLEDKVVIDSLMGIGRIVPHTEPEVIVDRSVGLNDDAPKKRGKKKA
jgi:hypothetical protein